MVFKSFLSGDKRNNRLSLGSPEAEGEANLNSSIPLCEVYEDYDDLMYQLTQEKFIVIGRKGCGKSAFAEYIHSLSISEPNLFCEFVKKNDSNLEKIVQIGIEENHPIERENLFKWIIYTKLLKLVSQNEGLSSYKDYEQLRQFVRKNRGFIDIKEGEIKELIRRGGFEVNVVPFKKFFTSKINKNFEIRQTKAPFYKLLPHLEEVILSLLTSKQEQDNDNSYVIFFDDLDIGFSSKDETSVDSIISLIRVCKYINNDVFGKVTANVKAVILLRDDIEKYISNLKSQADTAKLFSTYSCRINWFQNEYNSREIIEDDLNLKKFINKRIVYAFTKSGLNVNQSNPWSSLVSSQSDQSSFKYIVNHTLYRPRDLLLYFLPLQNGMFSYPLSHSDLFTLTGNYSEELAKELTNEMSSFYNTEEIKLIYNAIGDISRDTSCTYNDAINIIEQNCNQIDCIALLEYLFDRSIIGNLNPDNRWVYFKCREPINTSDPYCINKAYNIVVQNGFKVYFHNKGYSKKGGG